MLTYAGLSSKLKELWGKLDPSATLAAAAAASAALLSKESKEEEKNVHNESTIAAEALREVHFSCIYICIICVLLILYVYYLCYRYKYIYIIDIFIL
jgi:hypothetical protein